MGSAGEVLVQLDRQRQEAGAVVLGSEEVTLHSEDDRGKADDVDPGPPERRRSKQGDDEAEERARFGVERSPRAEPVPRDLKTRSEAGLIVQSNVC